MGAVILDGKAVADKWLKEAEYIVKRFVTLYGRKPKLAIVTVGDNQASAIYVRNKIKACENVGITALRLHFYTHQLESSIKSFGADDNIDALILQLPLQETMPGGARREIDAGLVTHLIPIEKDVDGLNPKNITPPCTPSGILGLLREYCIRISGKHVVIIGRSKLVGRPLAAMMLDSDATVTVCHSHTQNLAEITRTADILVSAVGNPHLVTADMVKPGAVVIDVGINRVNGKVVGDVDFDAVKEVAGYITPVPGGVGPLTVATLVNRVAMAAHLRVEEAYK